MAQFPTTPEQYNEQLLEFKRTFQTVEDEKDYYRSILRRFDNKHGLNLQDIQMLDYESMALLPPPNNWLRILNDVLSYHDNYFALNPSLKTYILQHDNNLDGFHKSSKLVDSVVTVNIVARKINSFDTVVSLATCQFTPDIKRIFENRAIAIMRQNPNIRRWIPPQLKNLSIAALTTRAYEHADRQEQKQMPTFNTVQAELKNLIESAGNEIKEQLNDICNHIQIIENNTKDIKPNHDLVIAAITDNTKEIKRMLGLRWWSLEWWMGK